MKKGILASLIIASFTASAGSMGPVALAPNLLSFVSIEGGYTWNKIRGLSASFDGTDYLDSSHRTDGGTGRVAVGVAHPINALLWLSGEIGWGYYGNNMANFYYSPSGTLISGIKLTNDLWGFDVLAGLAYTSVVYDLFFKAGALFENNRVTFTSDGFLGSPILTESFDYRSNHSEALPEIKLGGSYHMWQNLSIFAAWSHIFGGHTQIGVDLDATSGFINGGNVNLQNPTLDVATAGLRFCFA